MTKKSLFRSLWDYLMSPPSSGGGELPKHSSTSTFDSAGPSSREAPEDAIALAALKKTFEKPASDILSKAAKAAKESSYTLAQDDSLIITEALLDWHVNYPLSLVLDNKMFVSTDTLVNAIIRCLPKLPRPDDASFKNVDWPREEATAQTARSLVQSRRYPQAARLLADDSALCDHQCVRSFAEAVQDKKALIDTIQGKPTANVLPDTGQLYADEIVLLLRFEAYRNCVRCRCRQRRAVEPETPDTLQSQSQGQEIENYVEEIHKSSNPEQALMDHVNLLRSMGRADFANSVKQRYRELHGVFASPPATPPASSEYEATSSRPVSAFDQCPDKSARIYVFTNKTTKHVGLIAAHTSEEAVAKLSRNEWYRTPAPR